MLNMLLNSPGYIVLKPTSAYVINPMLIINIFLNKTFTVFFCLVSPTSKVENPKCIINTNNAEINIQRLSTMNFSSVIIFLLANIVPFYFY